MSRRGRETRDEPGEMAHGWSAPIVRPRDTAQAPPSAHAPGRREAHRREHPTLTLAERPGYGLLNDKQGWIGESMSDVLAAYLLALLIGVVAGL